jgi:hypothetical protein
MIYASYKEAPTVNNSNDLLTDDAISLQIPSPVISNFNCDINLGVIGVNSLLIYNTDRNS